LNLQGGTTITMHAFCHLLSLTIFFCSMWCSFAKWIVLPWSKLMSTQHKPWSHPWHANHIWTWHGCNKTLQKVQRMVDVKFKFLQHISHYNNNKFAFHMPMFIIYVLSFNKFNTTIHSNIRFMIIAYNQNLHFIMKNSKNKITIQFIII
jgi:hypothetical protein